MRTRSLILFVLFSIAIACDDETKVVDPIYEFVAFAGDPAVSLNEFQNSENPFPLTLKLLAFEPYTQDIDITLEIAGMNAEPNVDFVVNPSDAIKIRAGKLVSDTIWISTIDNSGSTDEERSFQVKIKSVSQPDIKIGLGLSDPENAAITFAISDDECSLTTSIFTASLNNKIGGSVDKSATGVVTGDALKVTGDLIDYSPLNASLTIDLTPEADGSTRGTAAFGEQEVGTDSDGYEYKFVEVGEGSYDVCSGTVSIEYDIYYLDGGAWAYWYTVTNVFSAP
jgi:hypothetical protein